MLLFAVNGIFYDAHKFILLYVRTNGELAIKVPNGVGLNCMTTTRKMKGIPASLNYIDT